jgi:hypothetical protein
MADAVIGKSSILMIQTLQTEAMPVDEMILEIRFILRSGLF